MKTQKKQAAGKKLQLREKLDRFGPTALSGAELLAVLYGLRRSETANLALASRVIENYGNRSIADARSISKMQEYTGLPREACIRTITAFELGRRYACPPRGRPRAIHQPADIYRLLRGRMENQSKECLYGVYLDNHNNILRESIISIGTTDQTFMQPREIFEPAFECHAAGIVVAHNHPDGNPEPSPTDLANTKKLQKAGEMMGFEILDHVIIGYGRFHSIIQNSFPQ